MKGKILLNLIVFALALVPTGCNEGVDLDDDTPTTGCIDKNCADYTSQAAAQADFNADPDCRNDLDADNDGIACEEAGNSVTTCASTSNCGCSNKNKSPCQSDPCCKWVVGTGCKCA